MKTTIAGIPCRVHVDHFFTQKPVRHADNPDDFYGYREVDFTVCDRGGRPAPWLASKLTDDDRCRIEQEIMEAEVCAH